MGDRVHVGRGGGRGGDRVFSAYCARDNGGDAGVDDRVERSARSLGAGPLRVALTITLPLAYRGIVAGALLGFVRAISEFGATIVVAGNIPGKTQTLPLAIYQNVQLGRDGEAMTLVAVSVALAIGALAVHNWLVARGSEE